MPLHETPDTLTVDALNALASTQSANNHVADSLPAPRMRRYRIPVRTRLDFWLDIALLVAFALDYSFKFTGLTIHEWIG
ncbi:MAG: hypothetical protein QOH53_2149, partial [Ilumatobacteraceae bacterium]